LYCGRQCIALRLDHEQKDALSNPGNFLALMRLVANHDERLKRHMDIPKLRNATYLSSQTQNEMIEVIGNRIIRELYTELYMPPDPPRMACLQHAMVPAAPCGHLFL